MSIENKQPNIEVKHKFEIDAIFIIDGKIYKVIAKTITQDNKPEYKLNEVETINVISRTEKDLELLPLITDKEREALAPKTKGGNTQQNEQEKFCPNCGKKLPHSAKFCGSCGNKFLSEAEVKKRIEINRMLDKLEGHSSIYIKNVDGGWDLYIVDDKTKDEKKGFVYTVVSTEKGVNDFKMLSSENLLKETEKGNISLEKPKLTEEQFNQAIQKDSEKWAGVSNAELETKNNAVSNLKELRLAKTEEQVSAAVKKLDYESYTLEELLKIKEILSVYPDNPANNDLEMYLEFKKENIGNISSEVSTDPAIKEITRVDTNNRGEKIEEKPEVGDNIKFEGGIWEVKAIVEKEGVKVYTLIGTTTVAGVESRTLKNIQESSLSGKYEKIENAKFADIESQEYEEKNPYALTEEELREIDEKQKIINTDNVKLKETKITNKEAVENLKKAVEDAKRIIEEEKKASILRKKRIAKLEKELAMEAGQAQIISSTSKTELEEKIAEKESKLEGTSKIRWIKRGNLEKEIEELKKQLENKSL